MADLRVAIVHDWLTGFRGGEMVLEQLLHLFPTADLHTLLHVKGSTSPSIETRKVHTSFLQHLPFVRKHYRWFLPLMPMAVEMLDVSRYDLVLSSSHCVAKGVLVPPGCLHVGYLHTPMRYVWDQARTYFGAKCSPLALLRQHVLSRLRVWDVVSANRVDHFVANSQFVKERIWKYYRRDAQVIHPPCDTGYFSNIMEEKQDFFLMVSALNPYKRIEVAIDVFNRLNKRLVIVGYGPLYKRLRRRAGSCITFLQRIPRPRLRSLYQQARALIQVAKEDFGIATIEAQAALTPVIAFGGGGAGETVRHGKTGILFAEQNAQALKKAVDTFDRITFNEGDFRQHVKNFSCEVFREKMLGFLTERGIQDLC